MNLNPLQQIDREIDAAKVEQQFLTTKAVQAVNNFIKERIFLQVLPPHPLLCGVS
jgi:hypothetical protein